MEVYIDRKIECWFIFENPCRLKRVHTLRYRRNLIDNLRAMKSRNENFPTQLQKLHLIKNLYNYIKGTLSVCEFVSYGLWNGWTDCFGNFTQRYLIINL